MSANLDAKRLAIGVPVIVGASAWVSALVGRGADVAGLGATEMGQQAQPMVDEDLGITTARILAGAWILAILLSIGAELSPAITKGFALLVLTTSTLVYGAPLWSALGSLTNGPTTPTLTPSLVGTTQAPGATRLPWTPAGTPAS